MDADSLQVERLYQYGERLNDAKDKSLLVVEYEGILSAAKGQSDKARQLAAQLIPRFFKYFPALSDKVVDLMFDLVDLEQYDLPIRVQAIRAFPLLCKDMPSYIPKIADVLGQLLTADENVERDAVHKALMLLLRQDVGASLTGLFKHLEEDKDHVREKVLTFLKDKVFPVKSELLKNQVETERYVADLVKKVLHDVSSEEFKFFMDFLKSLSIFEKNAPPERIQELVEVIESQADLDAQFNVMDIDHINRLILCMSMALPFFTRGAPSSRFLHYIIKHIFPVFDKFPEDKKTDLFKTIAGCSSYATAQDSRQLLPSVVQLLKKYMPGRKTENLNYVYVECLLYTFHHIAHKTPNSTNSLCGYKIVTGQPSDRLGEDFSDNYKDFTERLSATEAVVRVALKKLSQTTDEHKKAMSASKTEEAKAKIKAELLETSTKIRSCNNILAMTQPLHAKVPSFIGDDKINLSWKEPVQQKVPNNSAKGTKRPQNTSNGTDTNALSKKGRIEKQSQLVNRAFQGLSGGGPRGGARGSARPRNWGSRGRGRGYR